MADNIVLTGGVRSNLLALQGIADMMNTTQTRLATGKKVNTPLDNAVNYFTSAGLQSRAGDLSALLDAMSNSIQTVNAANHGITAIVTTIQSMQSTLMQARQDSTWQSSSFTIDDATIGTIAPKTLVFDMGATGAPTTINLNTTGGAGVAATLVSGAYIAPSTAYQAVAAGGTYTNLAAGQTYTFKVNGQDFTLDDGSNGALTDGSSLANAKIAVQMQLDVRFGAGNFTVADNLAADGFVIKGPADGTNDVVVNTIAAGGGAVAANLGFGVGVSDFGIPAQSYDLTINGTAVSIAAGNGLAQAANDINTALGVGSPWVASAGAGPNAGKLVISEVANTGQTLTITGASAAALFGSNPATNTGTAAGVARVYTVDELVTSINATVAGVKASNDAGKLRIQNLSTADLLMTGSTGTAIDGTANTSTVVGNTVRKNLVVQFNLMRDQLDKFAADSSFNGINLLQGDILKVVFNEQSSSTLDIAAKDSNGNLVVVNSTNLGVATIQNSDLDSNTSIDTLLTGLTQALQSARSQASNFGSSLSVVQNRQDFTKQMISTLKTGADNLIVADTNEEGANMLALQTRQQLSIAALSLANQANQSVLRLFG